MTDKTTTNPPHNSGSRDPTLSKTLRPYLDRLDQELSKIPFFVQLEERTGVKKAITVCGTFLVVLLFLMMNWAANFLSVLIGFVYPAYASIIAIETPDKSDDKQWLTYWVVFSFFSFLEFFADHLLFILPFYYLIKVLFLVYLFSPYTRGAEVLYIKCVRPLFFAARDETSRIVSEVNKRGWKEGMENFKEMLEEEVKKAM